jgi:CBS domain-containing protein
MYIDTTSATLISIFAFLTASTRTPISSIVMGIEIVGSYTLLIPTVISVIISNIISGKDNYIYKNYVSNIKMQLLNTKKHDSKLKNYQVKDVMNPDFYNVNKNTTVNDAIQIMRDLNVNTLVVTNNDDKFEGMVYIEDLRNISTIQDMNVASIMVCDPPMLRPLDPILDYFDLISKTAISEIPIISPDDSKLVLATLSINDINRLLNNTNDPILPDLENIKVERNMNNNTLHNFYVDKDFDKNSKVINKLRD